MKTKTKFKQTEIGMIPEEWDLRKVRDVASINEISIDKSFPFNEIHYIDIDSVDQGNIRNIQKLELSEAPSRAKRIVRDNDIIISTVRPNLKHFAIIKSAKPNTIVSTGFAVITSKKINPYFLFYHLTTDKYTNFLAAIADSHTSTYPSFNPDVIENSNIPIPSNIEQRAIAKILSDLDSKIELNQQMNKTLEEMGRAIFKHWFVDFEFPNEEGKPYKSSGGEMVYNEELGKEIPKGWRVGKIIDLCSSITNGGTPKRMESKYWGGNIAWFKTGELTDGILIDSEEHITEQGLKNSACKLWNENTILIALYASPTVGRLGLLKIKATANQACSGLNAKDEIGYPFLFYTLFFKRDEFNNVAVGAAQQNISQKIVQETKTIIPLQDIIMKFNTFAERLFDKQTELVFQNCTLSSIRDSLLPKLMSGKIRVPVEA